MFNRLLPLALLSGLIIAQAPSAEKGAKALFLDPTSGAAVSLKPTRPVSNNAPVDAGAQRDASSSVNAGIMYYIEWQRPDGHLERVNPSVTFRSGDRIRIQLKSNVNGVLTIAQRNQDGGASVLFPDSRVNGGDNHINAGQVTALPSATSWFRFDDTPGEEHLFVVLTPDGHGPSALPTVPQKTWDSRKTGQIGQLAQVQRGSKALVIEVEETQAAAATYVVKPAGTTVEEGIITTEIVLHHR